MAKYRFVHLAFWSFGMAFILLQCFWVRYGLFSPSLSGADRADVTAYVIRHDFLLMVVVILLASLVASLLSSLTWAMSQRKVAEKKETSGETVK